MQAMRKQRENPDKAANHKPQQPTKVVMLLGAQRLHLGSQQPKPGWDLLKRLVGRTCDLFEHGNAPVDIMQLTHQPHSAGKAGIGTESA
jgi:hypothetical protein